MRIYLLLTASCVFFCLLCTPSVFPQKIRKNDQSLHVHQSEPLPLAFRDFFLPSAEELKPSAKLLSANGQRVRLVGFMAQMEEPPKGAFYLVPSPLYCDEAGGGTADLPPQSVLVIVRSARNKQLDFIPRALEVTGILEIGDKTDEAFSNAPIRLILDQRSPTHTSAPRSAHPDQYFKQKSKRTFSEEK